MGDRDPIIPSLGFVTPPVPGQTYAWRKTGNTIAGSQHLGLASCIAANSWLTIATSVAAD